MSADPFTSDAEVVTPVPTLVRVMGTLVEACAYCASALARSACA